MIVLILCVVASAFVQSIDAIVGHWRLKRYVEARGYTLVSARWVPRVLDRQVRFKVTLERDEVVISVSAHLGGHWTGPVWSNRVEFDWDAGSIDDGREVKPDAGI